MYCKSCCTSNIRLPIWLAYIAGVINSFFWSKLWVFKKLNSNFMREAVLFLVSFGICYGIQFVALLVLVEVLLPGRHLGPTGEHGGIHAVQLYSEQVYYV